MAYSELEFINDNPIFTTRQFAMDRGISISSASRTLNKKSKKNEIIRTTSGIWAFIKHRDYNPYSIVPYLLDNETGYISFLTALHLHGIISQIPASIQIATTGHGRLLKSTIGHFEFFQINPSLMKSGIDYSETKIEYRIASPEKALFDCLYLATRKGNRFASLPELDLNRNKFHKTKFFGILENSNLILSISKSIKTRFNLFSHPT